MPKNGNSPSCSQTFMEALQEIGIDPNQQIFFNLWDDSWNPNPFIPDILKEMAEDGEIIVGMGKKVQTELDKLNIPHKKMTHPAARGKIRGTDLYRKHVREVLSPFAKYPER